MAIPTSTSGARELVISVPGNTNSHPKRVIWVSMRSTYLPVPIVATKKGDEKQSCAPFKSEHANIIRSHGSGYIVHYTEGALGPGWVQMQVCTEWKKAV